MIDYRKERLVPLCDAGEFFPYPPKVATLFKWAHRGIDGIVLDTMKIGGRRFTSQEAAERFILASTREVAVKGV